MVELEQQVTVTIPPVPTGAHPADHWRKTLTALNPDETGGYAITGNWLDAGDTITIGAGTLIVAVDKTTTGWDTHYRTLERYAVKDATITVHLATPEGLRELWSRHYKQAKSAFGASTMKKLTQLLDTHQPPAATGIAVVTPGRRPNLKQMPCRWCGHLLWKNSGQMTSSRPDAQAECHPGCMTRNATAGTPCALCGVTVAPGNARLVMVREGGGRWETRHHQNLNCTTHPVPSLEDLAKQQAAAAAATRAAARAEREKAERAAARRAAAQQKKKDAEAARHADETRRIAEHGITDTDTAARTLYDKNLGDGQRVSLTEHTLTLGDGSTIIRWRVTTYYAASGVAWIGEDYDPGPSDTTGYWRLADARSAYQDHHYQQAPRPTYRRPASGYREDDPGCPGPDVKHCDNCGIIITGNGMLASVGLACEVDCYDAMSDAHGRHARRYHRGV